MPPGHSRRLSTEDRLWLPLRMTYSWLHPWLPSLESTPTVSRRRAQAAWHTMSRYSTVGYLVEKRPPETWNLAERHQHKTWWVVVMSPYTFFIIDLRGSSPAKCSSKIFGVESTLWSLGSNSELFQSVLFCVHVSFQSSRCIPPFEVPLGSLLLLRIYYWV